MDLEEAQRRAAALVALVVPMARIENETLHMDEDDLCRDLIRSIAAGTCPDPAACCKAVLPVLDLNYHRWYA